jgi:mRNA interferase RelE/StbE
LPDPKPYEIVLKSSVERDLRRLPATIVTRILDRVDALSDDPFPRGVIKLVQAERLYRLRVGEYRIVYGVDAGARRITIYHVRHRSTAYRDR